MSNLKKDFQRTVTSFKNRLTTDELEQIKCNSLTDLHVVINRIQNDQRVRKEMMNLKRIEPWLERMKQFEQVVKIYLNVHEIVAFIWGPIKLLLQLASTWRDAFDTLLDAYEQIGEQIPLLLQYQNLFENNSHMEEVLSLMFHDILEFHERAIRFFADKAMKQIFKSVWKGFKPQFQHILNALKRHKELIESQASLSRFEQYQYDRMQAASAFATFQVAERHRMVTEVKQWLSSNDNAVEYELACAARAICPGSGNWVLEDPKIKIWKGTDVPPSPILWLNGIPGAGKSVLASVLIEDCKKNDKSNTAYFYCTSNDSQKNTSVAVLRGLISQLVVQVDDLLSYCHDKSLTSGETILTSIFTAQQLLELFCEKTPQLFLIIDGLDECSETERRVLLKYLNTLVDKVDSSSPGKLRLLVVSQIEGNITKMLSTATTLTVSREHNSEDIRAFIDIRIKEIIDKFDLDKARADYVVNATYSGASGMFLFAKLVMDNLFSQPNKESLYDELAEKVFPKELRGAYERILNRIQTRTKNQKALWKAAVQLLGWMTCAKRPLRWYEIQAAASLDTASQDFKFDEKKFRFDIRDLCGSLVLELPDNRLALVHSTAKQYILDTGYVSPFQVECHLTALCLEYLIYPAFNKEQSGQELKSLALKGHFAFHDYSVANWTYHVLALVASENQSGNSSDADHRVAFESREQHDELENALEDFIYFYREDLQHQKIDASADETCCAFESLSWYDHIKLLWSHCKFHSSADLQTRNTVSLPSLESALQRSRDVLEELGTVKKGEKRSKVDENLDEYYGRNRFKCPKVTCFWFHEGFTDHKTRQTHVSRHERPFRCEVADCSAQDLGLKTAKDLEKHTKSFHPSLDQHAVELFASTKIPPTKTPFACTLCPKKFTRKFHLDSHILNHNHEKPFPCSECGRPFTRINDRKRHEKIHSRRG